MLLAATLVGIALTVLSDDWRLGVRLIAVSLLGVAVLRALLPDRDAGMLAIRPRAVDVVLTTAIALALLVLAASIPDQPPL